MCKSTMHMKGAWHLTCRCTKVVMISCTSVCDCCIDSRHASGPLTTLGEQQQQQQHAEALTRCTAEVAAPLERQFACCNQQLKHATQRLQTAEQHLSSQKLSVAEAEFRALRAEGLMKKSKDRQSGLECDKRRLQAFVRKLKAKVNACIAWQNCSHCCLKAVPYNMC